MTPQSIERHLRLSFHAMYPTANIVVRGAGEEKIQVSLQFGTVTIIHWQCELDSDDDGAFWFRLADTDLVLKIPFPEEI